MEGITRSEELFVCLLSPWQLHQVVICHVNDAASSAANKWPKNQLKQLQSYFTDIQTQCGSRNVIFLHQYRRTAGNLESDSGSPEEDPAGHT